RRVSAPVLGRGESRAASLATAVRCFAGGLGVTIAPESAVVAESVYPGIGVARFADPVPGRTMGLFLRTATSGDQAYDEFGRVVAEVAERTFAAVPVWPAPPAPPTSVEAHVSSWSTAPRNLSRRRPVRRTQCRWKATNSARPSAVSTGRGSSPHRDRSYGEDRMSTSRASKAARRESSSSAPGAPASIFVTQEYTSIPACRHAGCS